MDLHKLEYVTAIAEENNITKAAEKLHISQPTLSAFLSGLERDLNLQLFTRKNNTLVITDAGRKYVAACRRILAIRDELYRELYEEKDRQIRVGMQVSNSDLLNNAIISFVKQYPQAAVSPAVDGSDKIYQKVLSGELDLGYVTSYTEDPETSSSGVSRRKVCEYELMACLSKDCAERLHIHPRDGNLTGENICSLSSLTLFVADMPYIRDRILSEAEKNGIRPAKVDTTLISTDFIKTRLVLNNVFCILPFSYISRNLVQVCLPTHPKIAKYLIWHKGRDLTDAQKNFAGVVDRMLTENPYYYYIH